MAQAMASMAGLSSSKAFIGSPSSDRVVFTRPSFTIRASQQGGGVSSDQTETSRRAVLGLVAVGLASGSFVQAVLADARPIKVGPPPPPSGGLPGTDNSDEARDLDLPLKNRFFLQSLTPAAAAERVKESAKEIANVKTFIDKKAWSAVQNDLRLRSSYLRFDLKTIIAAKPKDEKKYLSELTGKLFKTIDNLDSAAKEKNLADAQKYYAETVTSLGDVLAKLG